MNDEITTRAQLEAQLELQKNDTDRCPPSEHTMLTELLVLTRQNAVRLGALEEEVRQLSLHYGVLNREVSQLGKHLDETVGRLERVTHELGIVQGTQKSLGRRYANLEAEHAELAGKLHVLPRASQSPEACAMDPETVPIAR